MPRLPYVDAARAENSTLQLFPHVIMPNGDVKLHFEPNPGSPSERPRKAHDELMLDFRQNAVRDTAVHRDILREVRDAVLARGLVPVDVVPSRLRGPAGNVEFFMLVRHVGVPLEESVLKRAVERAPL